MFPPNIRWILPIFASQQTMMEICKKNRVEWESVVFFGMNEIVGEERGEKEERAEGWWWRGERGRRKVWLVWCGGGVVLWCGGVCLCTAQQISIKGAYTARTLFVRSSLQNMAREEVAHHVVARQWHVQGWLCW